MDWLGDVVSSEFLWGTVLGVALSAFTSWVSLRLQKREQRKTVALFCRDAILNISEYVRYLQDHRDRSRLIQSDFLDLIDVEVQVWGRNREHLVAFSDEVVRKKVRNFFTEISTHVVKARFPLQ